METHSVTEFWFYPDVSEDQLRTLAQEHFPDQGANGVMTLGALVTGNGVRSSLNGDANRGNSKGSSLLLASTSTKNLVKCPHWKHLAGNRDSCRNCKRHTTVTLWERRGHVWLCSRTLFPLKCRSPSKATLEENILPGDPNEYGLGINSSPKVSQGQDSNKATTTPVYSDEIFQTEQKSLRQSTWTIC